MNRAVSHGTVYTTILVAIIFAACPPVGVLLVWIPFCMHRSHKQKVRAARARHDRHKAKKREQQMIAAFMSLP